MRKAIVAGAAAVALVATAFVLAPTVWSQAVTSVKPERRVFMLDGRGSSIGVSIRDLDDADIAKTKAGQAGGALIESVDGDSPAAKAGLRKGDVVVELDGERVRSARHFARLVQETADGRSVKATVIRDGSRQTLDVTPSQRTDRWSGAYMELPKIADDIQREVERGMQSLPRDFAFDLRWDPEFGAKVLMPRGRLGAQLSPLSDQLAAYFGAKQGVLVSSVDSDSVAAKAGLKAGDVITSINGATVETPRDVTQALRDADAGKEIEIAVLRDKKALTLTAQMPARRKPASVRVVRPA